MKVDRDLSCFVFCWLFVVVLFCLVVSFCVLCVCACVLLLYSGLGPAGEPARASAYKKKQEANEERNSRAPAAVLFVSC